MGEMYGTAAAPSATPEDEMALFLQHLLSSSSSSSSSPAQSSDVALALAAGRAAGFIPQSGREAFSHVKTLQGQTPSLRLTSDSGVVGRRNLIDLDHRQSSSRDGTSTAESSALVDSSLLTFSCYRSASSTSNFPAIPVDDSDKKDARYRIDAGQLCSSQGSLLDRQEGLCLPSSGGGSFGSPAKDSLSGKRRKPPDTDFDDFDCESEEGQEISEEQSKPPSSRISLKRSRAAEVHNLSEKRRRSRINEKMKALQNLIPNSNKTDKASMLDEAIEYLKQLQLQVQILSMRNGLNLSPMYLPGGLQPAHVPQMRLGFGTGNRSPPHVNMGIGMLSMNQGPSTHIPFTLSNQCTPSHQPLAVHSETSFGLDPTPADLGPTYQLCTAAAEEIYRTGSNALSQPQLDIFQSARNPNHPAEDDQTKLVASSLPLDGQAAMLDGADCLQACAILRRENSQHMHPTDVDAQVLIQHLQDLKTGTRFLPSDGDIKEETSDV